MLFTDAIVELLRFFFFPSHFEKCCQKISGSDLDTDCDVFCVSFCEKVTKAIFYGMRHGERKGF